MKRRSVLKTSLLIIFFISATIQVNSLKETEPFFTLKFGVGFLGDYSLQVKDYLADINIKVELGDEMWAPPQAPDPMVYRNWDMITLFSSQMNSIDLRSFYSSNGSDNVFGLNPGIPYQNRSEIIQEIILPFLPYSFDEFTYFEELQSIIMDNILPLLPMFSPRNYVSLWSNINGYESSWGISESLPYMSYDGLHEGQVDLDEFRIADGNWRELNQIYSDDKSSELVIQLISEPILKKDPIEYFPIKTGIIEDWEYINSYHMKYYLRENIYWNPSFNITERDENSAPLDSSNTEQIMVGLKGEHSNGTNQKVTAKDVVFTLLAHANQNISDSASEFGWLGDCYVDANNTNAFHLKISNKYAEYAIPIESEMDMWRYLDMQLLPEFFLNSTNTEVFQTEGGIECIGLYPEIINTPQWITFSKSAFGCGKFMLDYQRKNSLTVLRKSPHWFGVGAIDGTTGVEPFVNTIIINVIPDSSLELMYFQMGELDLCDAPLLSLSERKEMIDDPRYQMHSYITSAMIFIAFNLNRPYIGGEDNQVWLNFTAPNQVYTKALAVRKAICYAIDRGEINQINYEGEYKINHRPTTYIWDPYWYNEFRVKYDYNLEKAWEWMERAGYEKPEVFKTSSSLTFAAIAVVLIVLLKIKKRTGKE